MKTENISRRRTFLKMVGVALLTVAAVPTALVAQSNNARPSSGNNLKQMILFGGVSEPNPSLPEDLGQVSIQFQMRADIGGTGGGFGTISDPVFGYANSHIKFVSGRLDLNDMYVFQGTITNSRHPDLVGKAVTVRVEVLPADNANVTLTIADTPLAIGMLLPAIQNVR